MGMGVGADCVDCRQISRHGQKAEREILSGDKNLDTKL